MILTTFLHGNQLTQKSWNRGVFRVMALNMPLSRLMGPVGSGMPVIVNGELKDRPGDQIIFDQVQRLTNAGIGDHGYIENNEEQGGFYNMPVVIHERGNGVRAGSPLSQKRTKYNKAYFIEILGRALSEWAADQVEDDTRWSLSGLGNQNTYPGQGSSDIATVNEVAPSSNRVLHGGQDSSGNVTFVDTLAEVGDGSPAVTSCYFGYDFANSVIAKVHMMTPSLRPIPFSNGKWYFLWLIHPLQAKSLKADSDWKTTQQQANVRDLFLNPLMGKMAFGIKHKPEERPYYGALGIIDDVVIAEYQRAEDRVAGEVFDASGDAVHSSIVDGTYRVARSLFLGQEAAILSWGKTWMPHHKDFDYNRYPGMAMDSMYGVRKIQFRDPGANQTTNTAQDDNGVVVIDTAVSEA